MKRLSIIVPMYNVGPYIERCLRSLEQQDIPENEYEIICINDGSTDNTLSLVKQLQGEFTNIVLLDQENQGVSMARNNGMDIAAGKYLMMVDADDFIKPDVLNKRLDIMDQLELDVGFTGFAILNEFLEEQYSFDPEYDLSHVLTGMEHLKWTRQGNKEKRDDHGSWSIFYKTSFLNSYNLRYLAGVPFLEDGEFTSRVTCLAKRTVFINGILYLRITRPGSATNSNLYYTDKARRGFIKCAMNLTDFKLKFCRDEDQFTFMNHAIIHFTLLSIMSLRINEYFRYYPELKTALKKGSLKKLETKNCITWHRKMAGYYNLSIHWFYINWQIFRIAKSIRLRFGRLFPNMKSIKVS